jgi:hypothetical protein
MMRVSRSADHSRAVIARTLASRFIEMPRRLALPLLALVAILGVLGSGLPAFADSGERAILLPDDVYVADAGPSVVDAQHPAQPSTVTACPDLVSADREIVWDAVSLEPAGPRGNPFLCLLYYPTDDIYWAVLVRFDGVEHFRQAKADAIVRLQDSGFDICRIGSWGAYGRIPRGEDLYTDDYMNLPTECAPRVVVGDPGAEVRAEAVRAALTRAQEVTAEQMGWRPNRPLTVIVLTDVNAAVRTYQRHLRGSGTAAQIARDGRSSSIRVSIFGGLILANLVKSSSGDAIEAFLMHEYTHFAQGGISGSNDYLPKWFIEGQAVLQEVRNTSSSTGEYLNRVALRAQRDSSFVPLSRISTVEDWNAQERRGAAGTDAAYSRGYAAVRFLEQRHGFDATVQLMRDNHNGDLIRFNELLAALTGADLEGLDVFVGTWLITGEIPVAAQPPQPASTQQSAAMAPPPAATATQPPAPTQPPATATPRPVGTPPPTATPPTAPVTLGPPNARFVAVDPAGSIRVEIATGADGSTAQGTVTINRPLQCGSARNFPPGSATFTVQVQPNGAFAVLFPVTGTTASITLDGRFFGSNEVRGSVRVTHTDAGCDTGLIAFVGRLT